MTDNEIIKAFESLYKKLLDVRYELKITAKEFQALNSVNALVKRQKEEIERLQERSERVADNLKAVLNERADHTEAIKDFSEEYKDHIKSFTGMFSPQLGFAVSLDAVLNAVDFVCENYKKN